MRDDRDTPRPSAVLVAGGAGFVGSHLCEALLARGHRVTCLDNLMTGRHGNLAAFAAHPRFRFVTHDVCDPIPPALAAERVYNLACPASPPRYQADPVHTMMTNVAGTRNLLAHAERHGARVVQASTSEVYGDPQVHPQTEDYLGHVNFTGPRACYDEGKRAAESLCADFARAGRVDVRVARIFNTYGPRMQADDGRIVSTFVSRALARRPLTVFGDGTQTRSFCYVSDMVAGLLALMDADATPGGAINLGNPEEISVRCLADLVLAATGTRAEIAFGPLPADDPRRRRPDITRAQTLLEWHPRVALPEGLRETVAWFASAPATVAAQS